MDVTNVGLMFEARFFIALGLGILLGLERETAGLYRQKPAVAGVRTHSLISLFGFGCAWLYQTGITAALPVGLISVTVFAGLEYTSRLKAGHQGWTSHVAILITFIVGALTLLTKIWVPLAIGIVSAVMLSEKTLIERYVESLKKFELFAILKFLVVTLLVLPLLPDQGYTRFDLNPARTWKIVILISSLGFAGYFLIKKYGARYGMWLSGLLGGIVSSTAVSIAVGRIARKAPEMSRRALRSSLLASSVMYLRILVLIAILGPRFVSFIWWKLALLTTVGLVLSLLRFRTSAGRPRSSDFTALQNPFELTPAVLFATLFLAMRVATNLVSGYFGSAGLFALSFIIGITDIDPFILSLVSGGADVSALLVKAILISMMGNTIIKGIYFGGLARDMRRQALLRYGIWAALHIPLIMT